MFKRLLKTTFGTGSGAAPAVAAAATPVQPAPPAAAPQHAWRALDAPLGVQTADYPDDPREKVHALFARPPRRLLDTGCASGAVAAGVKRAWPGTWAWGCELNPQAAAIAAQRLDHVTTVPIEQWTAQDIERLGGIDTVLLLDVLEHMYNPWAHLQFLARHLPSDAQVVVSLPNVGHIDVVTGLLQGSFRYAREGILDVTHIRFFTLREMQDMFEQTGFEIDVQAVLSETQPPAIEQFPAEVRLQGGKFALTVASPEEWLVLNAAQFGFRLRPAPGSAARA